MTIYKGEGDRITKWEFERGITTDTEIEEAILNILYQSTGQPTAIKIARKLHIQYLGIGGEPICEECSLKVVEKKRDK